MMKFWKGNPDIVREGIRKEEKRIVTENEKKDIESSVDFYFSDFLCKKSLSVAVSGSLPRLIYHNTKRTIKHARGLTCSETPSDVLRKYRRSEICMYYSLFFFMKTHYSLHSFQASSLKSGGVGSRS
jgi:hypothetical protein